MRALKSFLFIVFLCLLARVFSQQAFAIEVKSYEGLVNDFAQVLSAETEVQLEEKLQQEASRQNGAELAVVTLNSLEDQPIELVALAYFDKWQIGKKGEDNGVLVFLAIEDREIRIHTGYGAEGVLPDGMAGRIIDQTIIPHLRTGDYDAAVLAGVDHILAQIASPQQLPTTQSDVSIWTILLILLIFFGIIGLFIYLIAKHSPKTSGSSSSSRASSPLKTSSFSSRSKSSSSSSFSFGGGRSGGGGASRKW